MTLNKDLLLKYLCMALPYDVIVDYENHIYILNEVNPACKDMDYITVLIQDVERLMCAENEMIEDIKPYLRPMSSMTDEEATEITSICLRDSRNILSIKIKDEYLDITVDDGFSSIETITLWYDEMISSIECLYWLLEHHFDFMGLIPKGLAIEVTKENNPYENGL